VGIARLCRAEVRAGASRIGSESGAERSEAIGAWILEAPLIGAASD
jgi:hypothetical protein